MSRRLTPREFRREGEREMAAAWGRFKTLCDEYEWAWESADAPTVGDGARARSYASRPTENIAVSGYAEDEETAREAGRPVTRDGIDARGKLALRRELERCVEQTKGTIVSFQNGLESRATNLRKAFERIKGRSAIFEPPVRGSKESTTVTAKDMQATLDAQRRRQARREDPPLICSCKVLENGTLNRTALGNCAVHGPEPSGRRTA